MKFYHDIKEHCSPSALDQWFRQRSAFVKTYFEKAEKVETAAMKTGKQIHKLIEAGLINAKRVFDRNEEEIKVKVPGTEFYFLGIPDSRTNNGDEFVDYKSGKANDWKDKLPTDLKMKATAWLVWQASGEPEEVRGHIEFIQTVWNPDSKEVEPIDKETEVVSITYTAEELKTFTRVIAEAMEEVNGFYEKWLKSDASFVSKEDTSRYEELHQKKEALEREMDEIKERIKAQMEFGGVMNHQSELGTFYLTERKSYEYPTNLKINYRDMGLVLEDAEEIEAAAKAAKKNYELITEPVSVSQNVGFRPKREKK